MLWIGRIVNEKSELRILAVLLSYTSQPLFFTADLEFSDFRFLNMKIRTGVRAYIQLCACH